VGSTLKNTGAYLDHDKGQLAEKVQRNNNYFTATGLESGYRDLDAFDVGAVIGGKCHERRWA
jgi:hypothetical protein